MFETKMGHHNGKFQNLIKEYQNGNDSALEEILDLVTPYVYVYVENRYGKLNKDSVRVLVKFALLSKIKRCGYDLQIMPTIKSIFDYTYRRIEQLNITEDEQPENLIAVLTDRLESTHKSSLAHKQNQYEKLLKAYNNKSITREDFILQMFNMSNTFVGEFIEKYCSYDYLSKEDIESTIRFVLVEKINFAIDNDMFPENFYHWNARLKKSANLFLTTENKGTKQLAEKSVHVSEEYLEEIPSIDNTPEDDCLEADLKQVILEKIETLKPDERTIIELRYLKNYTLEAIAKVVGSTRQAVEQREKLIIEKLRRKMMGYIKAI